MVQSTASSNADKPQKPYADFPLFPHATKRWAKKINGKLFYFGPWNDWKAALAKYQEQKDDLYAGRKPRGTPGAGVTIRDLLNRFLTAKKQLQSETVITARTFDDYREVCERIKAAFGLTRLVSDLASDDFEQLRASLAKTLGHVALGNQIQRVRSIFKYAYDTDMIEKPIRFGPLFTKPTKKTLRKVRTAKGARMFEAAELRKMLEEAEQPLRAMLLLAVNCGFGNSDIGQLPLSALDLNTGWVNYPRPKTGVDRRCPLWPETVEALKEVIKDRPETKDPAIAALVFVTKYGNSWHKDSRDNPISKEMAKLLRKLGLNRHGVSFYALRHGFETVSGEARDQVATNHLMGHEPPTMDSVYRERISDERLIAVTDFVHKWLFGK